MAHVMRITDAHMRHALVRSRGNRLRKAATNLSLRADLVNQARTLGLNLSALVERALEEAIRDKQREAWLTENRDAIQAYNAQVERRSVFSEGRRRF